MKPALRLSLLFVFSIVAFTVLDDGACRLAKNIAPWAFFLGVYRIPSLAFAIVTFLSIREEGSSDAAPSWRCGSLWLVGSLGFAILGPLRPTIFDQFHGVRDYAPFLVTGLLAEEFLFRGAVLRAARAVLSDRRAVILSAVAFSLSHLQHWQHWGLGTAMQVGWTFVFGIILAWMAPRGRSLGPAVLLHVVNNLIAMAAYLIRK